MNKYDLGDVSYVIDHNKRIIYSERFDTLTKEGIYAEWNAIQQLDDFDASYEIIVNYSHLQRIDLDVSDLMELNRERPNHDIGTSNVAIVTGLKQGTYMLARFFCTASNLVCARKHQVFNTISEAELWLYSLRKHE